MVTVFLCHRQYRNMEMASLAECRNWNCYVTKVDVIKYLARCRYFIMCKHKLKLPLKMSNKKPCAVCVQTWQQDSVSSYWHKPKRLITLPTIHNNKNIAQLVVCETLFYSLWKNRSMHILSCALWILQRGNRLSLPTCEKITIKTFYLQANLLWKAT